jgi:uncharacterized protein YkwD
MTRTSQLVSSRHRSLSALACLTTVSLLTAIARPAAAADAPAPDLLNRVVDLTNAERLQAGLVALNPNPSLGQAAQAYAGVLAASNCFAHTCGPVPDFSQRAVSAGYRGWTALAENIAGGQPTPEAVVAAWMASPGHRANILNAAYTEIGVGVANGGTYGIYWAQEFGTRPDQSAPAAALAPAPAPAPAPAGDSPSAPDEAGDPAAGGDLAV